MAPAHAVYSTAPPAAPAPAPVSLDEAWTEHAAPNGMKYYYNSMSKESTYLKPDALKRQDKTSQWKEYQDASTGRSYYSDGVTTTWEKPVALGGTPAPPPTASVVAQEEKEPEPAKKKKKTAKETSFGSKEEAIAAFKGLLLAKDISPTHKWHEVAKICGADPRWSACTDVLSTGECKQALAEYQTKRANELRTIERQERARAKEVFNQLLTDILPSTPGFSAVNARFADVRDVMVKDDRFHAVADEETRESLFLDFCEELRKREDRRKRNKRREAQDGFVSFLKDKHEEGSLTYASSWSSFLSSLADEDKNDSRFVVTAERSDEDRQLYFSDYVIELQVVEDDKRRRIREARERAEREQKDAFRESLAQLAVEGKLLPSSRWRNVEELVSSHPSFGPVQAQDREAPREIFEAFADDWNKTYRRDRTFLSQLVYPSAKSDAVVKADTTFEEFTKALLDKASESTESYATTRSIINTASPVSSARLYFNELSLRARGISGPAFVRRGSALRRKDSESSEDEGEIVEEGEMNEILNA